MRLTTILTALWMTPTTALAQPFSESMADCAALYQNAAQWVQTEERVEKLLNATRIWAAAAEEQSSREGRPLSTDQVWAKIDDKTADWEARGATFFLSEEFRDWASYCRKFGKSQGIPMVNTGS